MSFLNPLFFWAFTAISIPIIIHLINFRRHKTLYFSNTRLLVNLKKETKSKTQLKQLLILLCRILTIAMLVFVFAGPYIPYKRDMETEKIAVTAIYVDNSFSMQAETKSGQLFDLARQTALEIANNSEANMQFLLTSNELKPEHQVLLNRENVIREIESLEIVPYQISLDELILKANTVIPENVNANMYIISDMQEHFVGTPNVNVNDNTSLIFMPLAASVVNNIFIDTCFFETPVHRYGQREKLIVRIRSFSNEDNYDVPLQLFINDSLKAFAGVNIEANETKDIELNYVNTVAGQIYAQLQITDYPIVYDNDLYFNYYIGEKIKILLINGIGENKYIKALYSSDPDNFEITSVRQGAEQSMNFGSFDFIILNEISDISTGLTENIKTFVDDGGSVAFIPAKEINHGSCNNFLSRFNAGVFNLESSQNVGIRNIDYEHLIFRDVFQRTEQQVDLPQLGFIHSFSPLTTSAPAVVLRAENQLPVLTSYDGFRGSLYVFSTPLNETNSDFVRHPLFVPIFYNMAINSQLKNPLYTILEPNVEYQVLSFGRMKDNQLIKITDNNELEIIPQHRITGRSLSIFIPEELNRAGNYEIIAGNNFISGLSVNYSRKESIANYYSFDELVKITDGKFGDNALVLAESQDGFKSVIQELGVGKMFWQLFLLLALLFIVCEILIIRFYR